MLKRNLKKRTRRKTAKERCRRVMSPFSDEADDVNKSQTGAKQMTTAVK